MISLSKIQYTQEEVREKMQITSCSDGSTKYFFENDTGNIQSTVYTPFPGVALVQKDVHIPNFITNWRYGLIEAFSVEYCRKGRLECQVDEEYLCISPGDIIIFRTDPNVRVLSYPSSYYCATSFIVYMDKTYPILECYLHQANFSLERLIQTYLPNNRYYNVLKNKDVLVNIFEDICNSKEDAKNVYFGLKILESLLLIASGVLKIGDSSHSKVSKISTKMAKQVYDYVMEHPEERYAIEDLAKEFSISSTQLKKYFQMVYGVPIQTFIREQKMKAAAKVLETSDIQVTKVAQMFGYKNISKFAAAFEQIMGETPKKYSLRYNNISDKTL